MLLYLKVNAIIILLDFDVYITMSSEIKYFIGGKHVEEKETNSNLYDTKSRYDLYGSMY